MSESYAGKINRKLMKKRRIIEARWQSHQWWQGVPPDEIPAAASRPPPDGSRRTWC